MDYTARTKLQTLMNSPPTTPELWKLAQTVRTKLLNQSAAPDAPLYVMVGHANLLDRVVLELYDRGAGEEDFDLEAGTVEDGCHESSESESDTSNNSDSDAESDCSADADQDGVECSEPGCCQLESKSGLEPPEHEMEDEEGLLPPSLPERVRCIEQVKLRQD